MMMNRVFTCLLVLLGPLCGLSQSPLGAIDASFGEGGWIDHRAISPPEGSSIQQNELESDALDRFYFAGVEFVAGVSVPNQGLITRYTADGLRDLTYGVQGDVRIPVPTVEGEFFELEDLAVGEDGTAYFMAYIYNSNEDHTTHHLFKVLPNGALDPEFGVDGRLDIDPNARASARVLLRPDGNFLMGLAYADFRVEILQYQPNGQLDPSFGSGGAVLLVEFPFEDWTLQEDGKILFAGTGFNPQDNLGRGSVARLQANGELDLTFGQQGQLFIGETANFRYRFTRVRQGEDGRIFLQGFQRWFHLMSPDHFVMVLDELGNSEFTFADSSKIDGDQLGRTVLFSDLVPVEDGGVVILGQGVPPGLNEFQLMLIKYNGDGSLDPDFGNDLGGVGIAFYPYPEASLWTQEDPKRLFFQYSGRLVAGTWAQDYFMSMVGVRLFPEPSVSEPVDLNYVLFPNPSAGGNSVQLAFSDRIPTDLALDLKLFNVEGKCLLSFSLAESLVLPNTLRLMLPPTLASGLYYVVVQQGENRWTKKLLLTD